MDTLFASIAALFGYLSPTPSHHIIFSAPILAISNRQNGKDVSSLYVLRASTVGCDTQDIGIGAFWSVLCMFGENRRYWSALPSAPKYPILQKVASDSGVPKGPRRSLVVVKPPPDPRAHT